MSEAKPKTGKPNTGGLIQKGQGFPLILSAVSLVFLASLALAWSGSEARRTAGMIALSVGTALLFGGLATLRRGSTSIGLLRLALLAALLGIVIFGW